MKRYIHEANTSRYPPQEKNKSGEVHEHWGIFSYDRLRKLLVLRQFHIEGFVNTYRQVVAAEGGASLVFESEAFENFSNSWKAREIYEFLSDDEFIETFELAAPNKPFELYGRNHFMTRCEMTTKPSIDRMCPGMRRMTWCTTIPTFLAGQTRSSWQWSRMRRAIPGRYLRCNGP